MPPPDGRGFAVIVSVALAEAPWLFWIVYVNDSAPAAMKAASQPGVTE